MASIQRPQSRSPDTPDLILLCRLACIHPAMMSPSCCCCCCCCCCRHCRESIAHQFHRSNMHSRLAMASTEHISPKTTLRRASFGEKKLSSTPVHAPSASTTLRISRRLKPVCYRRALACGQASKRSLQSLVSAAYAPPASWHSSSRAFVFCFNASLYLTILLLIVPVCRRPVNLGSPFNNDPLNIVSSHQQSRLNP